MLSPSDVETSTSLVLSGSGVPGPDAGVGTPAAATVAAGEAPSPAARRRSQSLQSPHATAAAGNLTHAPWTTSVIERAPKTVFWPVYFGCLCTYFWDKDKNIYIKTKFSQSC